MVNTRSNPKPSRKTPSQGPKKIKRINAQNDVQRKASAKRRPATESPGDTAEAAEESSESPFLRLSQLAKNLRDAAAEHPGAQGPLLEFLTKHWGQQPRSATPTRSYEEPFQSTANDQPYREDHEFAHESSMYSEPEKVVLQAIQFLVTVRSGMPAKLPLGLPANATFVYSAMQLALAYAPPGFHGLLNSLETLQTHLRQLFDETEKGRTAYRSAQCYLTELSGDFKTTLGLAKRRLMGEPAVEHLYDGWSDKVMSADLDYLDPLELLKTSVEIVTTALAKNLTKAQVAASAQRALASAAHSPGHVYTRTPPPPPGLDIPDGARHSRTGGKHHFKLLGKWGRFPTVKELACVLCGKGTHPGSTGHTGENCKASAEEVHNWVEYGMWVI